MDTQALWKRFKAHYFFDRASNFGIDVSRMKFDDAFLRSMEERMPAVYDAMEALEAGKIANPDEKRMVGHYWLRDSSLAPTTELKSEIESTLLAMKTFVESVRAGKIAPEKGGKFETILVVGIGGSALGPQFVAQALATPTDPMKPFFFDNTDPDGMEMVIRSIPDISKNLTIIISKSGGTKETRNGQLVAKEAYKAKGLEFAKHFVAVTGHDSELDKTAVSEKWIARFPMWDWVGGRTSELSAVGLLPALLQGINIDAILDGAKKMDALTRVRDNLKNPGTLLALSWYHAGKGKGLKDMVILPYKDRLALFSRYLQQLVMESLGKEKDLDGKVVNQGIAVYGNKGSTDQHAYVQQLRDGVNNFFVTFIEVLRELSPLTGNNGKAARFEVEPGVTCGDYLSGFYLGTRKALFESDRESVSITIPEVNPTTVGMLIALFERAVGYYGTLVNINAYHQPGVEAGKKAAADVLAIQKLVVAQLAKSKDPLGTEEIAKAIGKEGDVETVFKILRQMGANERVRIVPGKDVFEDRYGAA